jgi:hypothetical protein
VGLFSPTSAEGDDDQFISRGLRGLPSDPLISDICMLPSLCLVSLGSWDPPDNVVSIGRWGRESWGATVDPWVGLFWVRLGDAIPKGFTPKRVAPL